MARPRTRSRSSPLRLVLGATADESSRDCLFDQVAPFDLELRHVEQIEVGLRQAEVEPGVVRLPTRGAGQGEAAVERKADGDLLELERLSDSGGDGLEDLVD